MKFFILVLSCVCMVQNLSAETPDQTFIISLSRFNLDRVDAARRYFERRMRRLKTITMGASGAVVLGVVGKYVISHWRSRALSEVDDKRRKEYEFARERLVELSKDSKATAVEIQAKTALATELRLSGQGMPGSAVTELPQKPESKITETLRFGLTLGAIGFIVTSGQQVFRVCSGTFEEMLYLWWNGYEYWYSPLEDQVRAVMNQLRDSFYQARKVAQQSTTDQQSLIPTRQQRRVPLTYEISSHYRLDIVTMYQQLIGGFERLTALMFLMSPSEHHSVMQQHIGAIANKLDRVAYSLECDLNENTHGMLTHYSNSTLDGYHESVEAISIFLTTYRTYLRK
ncbi:MAG: hypothetical protein QG604_321 [Candidatus Dependentiae bacterium]|nr:hypothetical protein [Candidatus Dependentiae bacterium]